MPLQDESYGGTSHWHSPNRSKNFGRLNEPERFRLQGARQDRLEYLVREPNGVAVYSRPLGLEMAGITEQYRRARQTITDTRAPAISGVASTVTYLFLTLAIWIASLLVLIYFANRISRPIQQLTGGLSELAKGNFSARLASGDRDEVGLATSAFNETAAQLAIQPRPPHLSHATGKLAGAGAQDGA